MAHERKWQPVQAQSPEHTQWIHNSVCWDTRETEEPLFEIHQHTDSGPGGGGGSSGRCIHCLPARLTYCCGDMQNTMPFHRNTHLTFC